MESVYSLMLNVWDRWKAAEIGVPVCFTVLGAFLPPTAYESSVNIFEGEEDTKHFHIYVHGAFSRRDLYILLILRHLLLNSAILNTETLKFSLPSE